MRRASSEVVPRLLDGDDVRDLGELGEGLHGDEVHHPRRDVVVDDRLVRHGSDRLHVLDDPSRRRLVVVRRDDEEAVDAEPVCLLGQVDGVAVSYVPVPATTVARSFTVSTAAP